jgi:hypothetical protein
VSLLPGSPSDLRPSLDTQWALSHKRVPTFYGGPWNYWMDYSRNRWSHFIAALWQASVGLLFGSIHAGVGWHLPAPTTIELHMWRISSIIMLGVPFWMIVDCTLIPIWSKWRIYRWVMSVMKVLRLWFLLFCVYILARIALIVLTFTLLRDLPKAAFQEVVWTKYIPHV